MEKILDIIFPKKCIECGKQDGNWVCKNCLSKSFDGKIEEFKSGEIKFLISLFSYDKVREKILKFKFNDMPFFKNYFLEILKNNRKIVEKLKEFDLIIPVPMYFWKKLKRGYNQSELIAIEISKFINIEMRSDILIKYKNTKTQSLLNKKERIENLNGSFKLKNIRELENKNILIVDDIYTTGSTIKECIKQLKNVNCKSISVFVIAKNNLKEK